jgi:ubiquinone/menaquinone biosynthesis C-methylase UbiE
MNARDSVKTKSEIEYHLRELHIAEDAKSPSHILPDYSENDRYILDIGCGIGKTLSVEKRRSGGLMVGLDVDLRSLTFGRNRFGHLEFVNGTAEELPFRSGTFDFVFSRVSLPLHEHSQSLVGDCRGTAT